MANWIDNTLTVDRDFSRIEEYCLSNDLDLDFQKIRPCPQELLETDADSVHRIGYDAFFSEGDRWKDVAKYPWVIEAGVTAELGRETFMRQFNDAFPKYRDLAIEADELVKKYGFSNWYDWRVHNWGTKWRAWDVVVLQNGFSFMTAWEPPWGILEELQLQFPEVTFTLTASDEQCNGRWEFSSRNLEVISGSLDRQDSCPKCRAENNGECWAEESVLGTGETGADLIGPFNATH